MAASFHPELTADTRLHERFVELVRRDHRSTRSVDMSGHSKWATIKHKKGAADKARGKLFNKLARQLEVAARAGGGDPDANPTLRTAVQKAKARADDERRHRPGDQARHRRGRRRARTSRSCTRATRPAAWRC